MSLIIAIICLQLGLVLLSRITTPTHGGFVIAQGLCVAAVIYLVAYGG